MPPVHHVSRTLATLLSLFVLSGCARSAIPFVNSPIGSVSGRIERVDQGAAVIHMEAIGWWQLFRARAPQPDVVIEGGLQRPRIALVRPDQPLRIANLDSIYHEIFAVEGENQFRARLAGGDESASIALRTPGFVHGYCRLHPHESFAFLVTEADHVVYIEGRSDFEIPAVPAGEYIVAATGLHAESEPARLRVVADETVDLTLRLVPRRER